jgi:hypothetical protein
MREMRQGISQARTEQEQRVERTEDGEAKEEGDGERGREGWGQRAVVVVRVRSSGVGVKR